MFLSNISVYFTLSLFWTYVLAEGLLENPFNVSVLREVNGPTGTDVPFNGPAVENGQEEVNPYSDTVVDVQCALGTETDRTGNCMTPPDDQSNRSILGEGVENRESGAIRNQASEPADGPVMELDQAESNNNVLPQNKPMDAVITAPSWPCPEGEMRDHRGKCRKVV